MGPRIFIRGYVAKNRVRKICLQLQWGRGFSSADTVDADELDWEDLELQWGRGFSSADTSGRSTADRPARRFNGAADFHPRIRAQDGEAFAILALQWGRGFSSADTQEHALQPHR